MSDFPDLDLDLDIYTPARPEPAWVISEFFTDTDLGLLKTGKEAEVTLVERQSNEPDPGQIEPARVLMARKRYRPRSVTTGELKALGFTRAGSFRNDLVYRDGRKYAKSRDQRAVERMTNYGKELIKQRWTNHEFEIMRRAWRAGVPVPYPVEELDDGFLMEFLGDEDGAAPRLVQARLTADEAIRAFGTLIDAVATLAATGIVHGDLSPYNILWWDEQPWLIDFPQAMDIASIHGIEFLTRDVANLCRWYAKFGGVADPEQLVLAMVRAAPI